jgi:poly(hydroxyalkanoate) depolymerase family esterase
MDPHQMARMHEATRLTRQGRLAEAAALLHPGNHPGPPPQARPGTTPVDPPTRTPTGPDLARLLATTLPTALPNQAPTSPLNGRPTATPRQRGAGRPPSTAPGRFLPLEHGHGTDRRAYRLYVPTGYAGRPVPLLVMLHGGTQNADDFAAGTGMNHLAERHTFLVAYPEQSRAANPMGYWNWFEPADQRRGAGEPATIAGITAEIRGTYAVDPRRVGVAGFSAGGAMAAVVAAAYPDVFTTLGVHSGLAAGAAHDMPSAFAAMRTGGARPVGTPVPAIVFHGDADPTVDDVNAGYVLRAAAPRGGRPPVTETRQAPGGHRYTVTVHTDERGTPVAELWTIHGAGHAWSGGRPDGSYTDPHGPDASAGLVRFLTGDHAPARDAAPH